MAQPDHYVQTDCSALDHPKVHALAEELRCHEITAFGAVVALRCRAMRHCPDGDVTGVSERTLKVWLLGLPRVEWKAFIAAKFVDEVGERRVMHGWSRYDGKEARRLLNAARAKKWRDERARNAFANAHERVTYKNERVRERESNGTEREGEGELKDVTAHVGSEGPVRPLLPTPARDAEAVRGWWNATAAKLPGLIPVRKLEGGPRNSRGPRLKAAAALILANTAALEAELSKPFYRGGGSGRWCADLDYLIQPGKLEKLLERAHAPKPPSPDDLAVEQAVAEYEREQFAAKESA